MGHRMMISTPRERLYLVCLIFLSVTVAQLFASDRIYCYQKVIEPGAAGGGKVQVNGFTIEVKPIPDPTAAGFTTCHASVISSKGRIVYEKDDWGMEIDRATGHDINEDGQPEAVLVSYSGGAHCCWTYHIIGLGKQPGLIREFENRDTASFEDLGRDGKTEILIRVGDFDFGFGQDHADSVFPLMIVQLKGSKFQDVGQRFWRVFQKEISENRARLGKKQLGDFLNSNPYDPNHERDYSRTKSTILLIVLDHLYAGRHQEARRLLAQLWPAASQEGTWQEMLEGYCGGVRAALELQPEPPCPLK